MDEIGEMKGVEREVDMGGEKGTGIGKEKENEGKVMRKLWMQMGF